MVLTYLTTRLLKTVLTNPVGFEKRNYEQDVICLQDEPVCENKPQDSSSSPSLNLKNPPSKSKLSPGKSKEINNAGTRLPRKKIPVKSTASLDTEKRR